MPVKPDQTERLIMPEDSPETITLSFVEADDAIEPEKPSKLKAAFKQVFTTTEEEERAEKKPRKRQSRFFVKHTPLVCGGLLVLIHWLAPEEYRENFYVNDTAYSLLPSQEHLQNILTPIARIADRHTHIADINPDMADILASLQASAAYGMELRAALLLKHHLEKKQKQEQLLNQQDIWRKRINDFGE